MNRKPPNAGKGRPKGVPNKVTREIKALAQSVLERPEYLASLQERLDSGKAPHMETLLHHYAYGKPKDIVEVNQPVSLEVPILYTRADILSVRDGYDEDAGGDVETDED